MAFPDNKPDVNINVNAIKAAKPWSASCSWAIHKADNNAALIVGPATDGNACVLLFGGRLSALRYRIVPWSALRPWVLNVPGQWAIHQPTRRPAMIVSDPDSTGLVHCLILEKAGFNLKKVDVSLLSLRSMKELLDTSLPSIP